MNDPVVVPVLVALGALILAALERRAYRRRMAELEHRAAELEALLAARGANGSIDWLWPAAYHEEEETR